MDRDARRPRPGPRSSGTSSACDSGSRLRTRATPALRSHGSSSPTRPGSYASGDELALPRREPGEVVRLRRLDAVDHVRVGPQDLPVQVEARQREGRPAPSEHLAERRAVVEAVREDAPAVEVVEPQRGDLRQGIEERGVLLRVEAGPRSRQVGHRQRRHQGHGPPGAEDPAAHRPRDRPHGQGQQQHDAGLVPRHLARRSASRTRRLPSSRRGRAGRRPAAPRGPPRPPPPGRPRRRATPRRVRSAAGRPRSRRPSPPRGGGGGGPCSESGRSRRAAAGRRGAPGHRAPRARTRGRAPRGPGAPAGPAAAAPRSRRRRGPGSRGPRYRDRK